MSSANVSQSNGRAEVAVKKAKRMRMDNVGPTGSLNNDGILRALLQARNTRTPIAIYHQQRWYLAGPFAMLFPSPADESSTTTHRYDPYTCIRDHLHLYRSATMYSCRTNVVHTLINGTNRVSSWSWATTTNTG